MTVSFMCKEKNVKVIKKNLGFLTLKQKRKKYFHVHTPLVAALRYSPRGHVLPQTLTEEMQ